MKFITDIDKNKFEEFVTNNIKSHFLQSYKWGEFSKLKKNLIPHYVGMVNENDELVCAALLLEKKLPLGYSYLYAPRGYVIDFTNNELLKLFTLEIKDFAKESKCIFIKIDPDVIINQTNCNGDKVETKYDGINIYNNLKKMGYKHLGFTKNFETMQPRYTFRIDMERDFEEIENNFSKTTKQRIKKANDLDVDVKTGTKENIKDFFNLMAITENRKDFVTHELDYYEALYDIFSKEDLCNIFLGTVDLNHIIDKYESELKDINNELDELNKLDSLSKTQNTKKKENEKRKEKLVNDIEKYKKDRTEYGSKVILNAHFIIEYGNKAWVLYAGNHNILTETGSNYLVYKDHIKYYYDKGTKIYDQFGTIGDLENEHLIGLHDFKKKFGGDYIEFIGEFDLITNKFMYFVFNKLVPVYRNMIKKSAKNRRKKS